MHQNVSQYHYLMSEKCNVPQIVKTFIPLKDYFQPSSWSYQVYRMTRKPKFYFFQPWQDLGTIENMFLEALQTAVKHLRMFLNIIWWWKCNVPCMVKSQVTLKDHTLIILVLRMTRKHKFHVFGHNWEIFLGSSPNHCWTHQNVSQYHLIVNTSCLMLWKLVSNPSMFRCATFKLAVFLRPTNLTFVGQVYVVWTHEWRAVDAPLESLRKVGCFWGEQTSVQSWEVFLNGASFFVSGWWWRFWRFWWLWGELVPSSM